MGVVPLVGREAGHHEQREAHEDVGGEHVHPAEENDFPEFCFSDSPRGAGIKNAVWSLNGGLSDIQFFAVQMEFE